MEERLREAFLYKIYGEYKDYQASVLSLGNIQIYEKCYEIDCVVNFYEILLAHVEIMSEETLSALLGTDNVLMILYDFWLAKEDSSYSEMENFIAEELEVMTAGTEKAA